MRRRGQQEKQGFNLEYAKKMDQAFGRILDRIRKGSGKASKQDEEEVMALFHISRQQAIEKLSCCLGYPHPCRE